MICCWVFCFFIVVVGFFLGGGIIIIIIVRVNTVSDEMVCMIQKSGEDQMSQ